MIHYIAGDIGGTNSRLQLWRVKQTDSSNKHEQKQGDDQDETLIAERTYPSQKYASLTFVIEKFLKEVSAEQSNENKEDLHPIACCLAVAGPVRANKATITNVSWVLDGAEMSQQLRIPDVLIINDFVGIGYGLLALTRKDVIPINDVPLAADAPKACIGAGTGLGEVYLTAGHLDLHGDNKQGGGDSSDVEYNVWASEGGHADFAPRDALEFGLLEYLKTNERVTRVSVERIVSGLGIPGIYNYFAHNHPEEVNSEVTARLRTEDPGAVIAEFAENGKCTLCRQAIELFVKCYGAEAGNTALKTLPFGGLYIAGGIAPKLKNFMLRGNLFYQHFVQKGRMQALLEKVPLFIVTHPAVGLLGAKVVCRRLLRRQGFLPGRGELVSFTEATPRSLADTFGESFSYPTLSEGTQFETEVTLEPKTKQPEKVVIRRRPKESPRGDGVTFASDTAAAGRHDRDSVQRSAFTYGILGGAIASILSIGALTAINWWTATRRGPPRSIQ